MTDTTANNKTQLYKSKEAARELEAGEDEKRWKERLKKIARHKPDADAPPRNPVAQKKL